MNIALLGYGTVGRGVDHIVSGLCPTLKIARILKRPGKLIDSRDTDSFDTILADTSIELVAECMGGIEPARSYILAALTAGKHVVTANKAVVARHFDEFAQVAAAHQVGLFVEATTGGGMPWIAGLRKMRRVDALTSFSGILNGTSNYILDRMVYSGSSFDEVLIDAQKLGYAEADPSADIDGMDVANKTIISAVIAFDVFHKTEVPTLGIRNITRADMDVLASCGLCVKLMGQGIAKDKSYALAVQPVVLPMSSLEAHVPSNFNSASAMGSTIGELKFYGQGAGGLPTGNAMVQDILDCEAGVRPSYCCDSKNTYNPALLTSNYLVRTATTLPAGFTTTSAPGLLAANFQLLCALTATQAARLLQQLLTQDPHSFMAAYPSTLLSQEA